MGQIVSLAAKPKRCNANQLSQVPTPAAGEHILVSSDNSMNAAGQGNFDCYIVGDGHTAATALELKSVDGVSQLEAKVTVLDGEMEGYTEEELTPDSFVSGKLLSSVDGSYVDTTATTYKINEYSIVGNTQYLISGRVGSVANTCLVAFFNGNTFLSSQYVATETAMPYESVSVIAPRSATKMRVSGTTSSSLPNQPFAVRAAFAGIKTKVEKMEDAIGQTEDKVTPINMTWVQGSIDLISGANVSSATTIRTTFINIQAPAKLKIVCSTGYFIKAVLAYNTENLADFYSWVVYNYKDGDWDTTKTSLIIEPNGKVLRICIGKVNGGNIVPSDGSNISLSANIIALTETIVEEIQLSKISIVSIEEDLTALEYEQKASVQGSSLANTGHFIDFSTSTWSPSDYYDSALLDVSEYRGCVMDIEANGGYLAFLLTNQTSGSAAFAEGYNSLMAIPKHTVLHLVVPDDAGFLYVTTRRENYDLTPSLIVFKELLKTRVERLENTISSPLMGKRLYVLGDSIAQGIVSEGVAPTKPWPVIVSEELGMPLTNYGISSSTVAVAEGNGGMFASLADLQAAEKVTGMYYTVLTGNQTFQVYYWDGNTLSTSSRKLRTPVSQRYTFMGNDADVVIVAAGTNDFQYNWTDIGTIADRTNTTFYGAMNLLCEGLLDKYLGKTIIFCTPIKRAQTNLDTNADTVAHRGGSYGSVWSENLLGLTLGEYCDIIKEVCALYSIPVIDMYSSSLLNPSLTSQSSLFDSWKTHPRQEGHDMMARYIIGRLKAIYG